MKQTHGFFVFIFLLLACQAGWCQEIWFNEIHYDNISQDTLEFIEIVCNDSLYTDQHTNRVYLYNGLNGIPYDSVSLSDMQEGAHLKGYVFLYWYPATIQNGPDGMALTIDSELKQFLSYENAFTATEGVAKGTMSDIIPVSENGAGLSGLSLGLTGKGSDYSHFNWQENISSSPGEPNAGQIISSDPYLLWDVDQLFFEQTPYGTISMAQSYHLSGANLEENIEIPVPYGFEISLSADFHSHFQYPDTLELPVDNDRLLPLDVFIRFVPGPEKDRNYTTELHHISGELNLSMSLSAREGEIYQPVVWINEFHYDNEGTDQNEFVEIVTRNVEDSQLPSIQVDLYNGSNGKVYDTHTLSEYIPGDTIDGIYRLYYYNYDGIQNGGFDPVESDNPDGIAVSYHGRNLQFISYEGTFQANDGPVASLSSQDILVSESPEMAPGSSLQLDGDGYQYGDFEWIAVEGSNTKGHPNISQVLPIQLLSLSLQHQDNELFLSWETATEMNNERFIIEKSMDGISYQNETTIPADQKNVHIHHYQTPLQWPFGRYYRLKQQDRDGKISIFGPVRNEYNNQPHLTIAPLPLTVNSKLYATTTPSQNLPIQLEIINSEGHKIYSHRVPWESRELLEKEFMSLSSGVYFILLSIAESPANQIRVVKM